MNWTNIFEIAAGIYLGLALRDFSKGLAKLLNHIIYGADYDSRLK